MNSVMINICLVVAVITAMASAAGGDDHDLPIRHPELFQTTLESAAGSHDFQSRLDIILKTIREPKRFSHQQFYYSVSDLSFVLYQQARRELNVADGSPVPLGADCPARDLAVQYADQIKTALVDFARLQVVLYSTQPDPIPNSIELSQHSTPLLRGDLLMWQQVSWFLHYFDQAMWWINPCQRYPEDFNEILYRMSLYMVDCAPYLVVQNQFADNVLSTLSKDDEDAYNKNVVFCMKQPEGWLWRDLYKNLMTSGINLKQHDLGKAVSDVYEQYKEGFGPYPTKHTEQEIFPLMQTHMIRLLYQQYLPEAQIHVAPVTKAAESSASAASAHQNAPTTVPDAGALASTEVAEHRIDISADQNAPTTVPDAGASASTKVAEHEIDISLIEPCPESDDNIACALCLGDFRLFDTDGTCRVGMTTPSTNDDTIEYLRSTSQRQQLVHQWAHQLMATIGDLEQGRVTETATAAEMAPASLSSNGAELVVPKIKDVMPTITSAYKCCKCQMFSHLDGQLQSRARLPTLPVGACSKTERDTTYFNQHKDDLKVRFGTPIFCPQCRVLYRVPNGPKAIKIRDEWVEWLGLPATTNA